MRQYPSIHEPQIAVSDGGHGSGRRCGRRNTVPSERIPWTLPPAPTRFFPLSSRRRARVKTDGFHTVSVDLRFSPSVRCTKRPMQAVLFGVHVFLSSSHWVVTIVLIPRTVNSAPGGSSSPAFSGQ